MDFWHISINLVKISTIQLDKFHSFDLLCLVCTARSTFYSLLVHPSCPLLTDTHPCCHELWLTLLPMISQPLLWWHSRQLQYSPCWLRIEILLVPTQSPYICELQYFLLEITDRKNENFQASDILCTHYIISVSALIVADWVRCQDINWDDACAIIITWQSLIDSDCIKCTIILISEIRSTRLLWR